MEFQLSTTTETTAATVTATATVNMDNIIENLIYLRNKKNELYIDKYNTDWILSYISGNHEMKLIESKFKLFGNDGVDLITFVRILLSAIQHEQDETLYIAIGIIDLFKEIKEIYDLYHHIKCIDLVNYIIEVFLQKVGESQVLLTRKIPEQKRFHLDPKRIREIDINAPIITGDISGSVRRLMKNKIVTDSYHHNENGIIRAYYANEIKKLFTLDSLSGIISVYDLNCYREKIIKPKLSENNREIIILNFAWSNKQNRLGCCLKDFTLCFWDADDNFEFEKTFYINNIVSTYQTNIWYIQYLNIWITTDNTHSIIGWDIEKEQKQFVFTSTKIKRNILDIIAIEYLKLSAVSSLDRAVTIWDFSKGAVLMYIDLKRCGIHTMCFFNTYQTLVTVGYENVISLWSINPIFFDHTLIGQLIGHPSMVTAIEIVEKSPMIISADDNGEIKIWDIRNLNCIQTLSITNRTKINKLIDISDYNKLCFLGSRVNFLEYDNTYSDMDNILKNKEHLWPISVEYNFLYKELIICTRKDLRIIDIENGRVKKIMVGLLMNNDDDITKFRLIQHNKKFIIGDHRGNLGLYAYLNSEKIKDLVSHTQEITNLKIDHVNKLIVTSSWDSTILIQKEINNTFEIKRRLINLHYGKEITLLELSVYHNIIITATSNNILYVWDYEYGKLIGSITLDNGAEPTFIQFINGYSIILIADTYARIHFLQFSLKDSVHFRVRRIAYIKTDSIKKKLNKYNNDSNNSSSIMNITDTCMTIMGNNINDNTNINGNDNDNDNHAFLTENSKNNVALLNLVSVNKILVDIDYNDIDNNTKKPFLCNLYISTNRGDVYVYDLNVLFENNIVEYTGHANTRPNYNANRSCNEDFEKLILNLKIYNYDLRKIIKSNKVNQNINTTNSNDNDRTIPEITVSSDKKFIFDEWEVNPFKEINLKKHKTLQFQAHKEILTALNIILCPEKKLLTCSLDGYLRIWDLNSTLQASFNINHPLPISWNLKLDHGNKWKKNVLYAMRTLDSVLKRFNDNLTPKEIEAMSIEGFLSKLESKKSYQNEDELRKSIVKIGINTNDDNNEEEGEEIESIIGINESQKKRPKENIGSRSNSTKGFDEKKVFLMKDEYSPRDLQYENVKKIYQKDLRGPNLKQIDNALRLDLAQKMWKEANMKEKNEGQLNDDDGREKSDDFMSYLLGEKKIMLDEDKNKNVYSKNLARKLDSICRNTNRERKNSTQDKGGVRTPEKSALSRDYMNSTAQKLQISLLKLPKLHMNGIKTQRDDNGSNEGGMNEMLRSTMTIRPSVRKTPDNSIRFEESENESINRKSKYSINRINQRDSVKKMMKIGKITDLKRNDYIFDYASRRVGNYESALLTNKQNSTVDENLSHTQQSLNFQLGMDKTGFSRRIHHNEIQKLLGLLNDNVKQSKKGGFYNQNDDLRLKKQISMKSIIANDSLNNMSNETNLQQQQQQFKTGIAIEKENDEEIKRRSKREIEQSESKNSDIRYSISKYNEPAQSGDNDGEFNDGEFRNGEFNKNNELKYIEPVRINLTKHRESIRREWRHSNEPVYKVKNHSEPKGKQRQSKHRNSFLDLLNKTGKIGQIMNNLNNNEIDKLYLKQSIEKEKEKDLGNGSSNNSRPIMNIMEIKGLGNITSSREDSLEKKYMNQTERLRTNASDDKFGMSYQILNSVKKTKKKRL